MYLWFHNNVRLALGTLLLLCTAAILLLKVKHENLQEDAVSWLAQGLILGTLGLIPGRIGVLLIIFELVRH